MQRFGGQPVCWQALRRHVLDRAVHLRRQLRHQLRVGQRTWLRLHVGHAATTDPGAVPRALSTPRCFVRVVVATVVVGILVVSDAVTPPTVCGSRFPLQPFVQLLDDVFVVVQTRRGVAQQLQRARVLQAVAVQVLHVVLRQQVAVGIRPPRTGTTATERDTRPSHAAPTIDPGQRRQSRRRVPTPRRDPLLPRQVLRVHPHARSVPVHDVGAGDGLVAGSPHGDALGHRRLHHRVGYAHRDGAAVGGGLPHAGVAPQLQHGRPGATRGEVGGAQLRFRG